MKSLTQTINESVHPEAITREMFADLQKHLPDLKAYFAKILDFDDLELNAYVERDNMSIRITSSDFCESGKKLPILPAMFAKLNIDFEMFLSKDTLYGTPRMAYKLLNENREVSTIDFGDKHYIFFDLNISRWKI